MAWNEPGGNDNDPWGNRKNSDGPPDLDEVFKNLKKKFTGAGGNSNRNGSGGGIGIPGGFSGPVFAIVAGLAFMAWLASGIYTVQAAERGVVTQFGKHIKTVGPGLNWHLPWPVQAVDKVNVQGVREEDLRGQFTLTRDENIVRIELTVQYIVSNAEDFLFNVRQPDVTLTQVLESALREVVGQANMDSVLVVEGQEAVAIDVSTQENLQAILDGYKTGIEVTAVNLVSAQPPDEVQAAFDDAIKAREDKERFINEAEAYRNQVLPRARGDAQRLLEEAEGYKSRVVQAATGESQRFVALLEEFKKAPEVTRERLYLESMESVFSNTSKVLIDGNNGNSLMYLPIDKLIEQNQGKRDNSTGNQGVDIINDASQQFGSPSPASTVSGTSRSRERGATR